MTYSIITGECRISSPFGNRKNPFAPSQTEFHKGVDFAPIPPGKSLPILAIEDATVLLLRYGSPELGNYVELLHENGYVSRYQHLYSISSALKVNQPVKAGTYLGMMGTTGSSTGVHLHLGIRTVRPQTSGDYIDPMPYVNGTKSLKKPSAAAPKPPTTEPSQPAPTPPTVSPSAPKVGDTMRVKASAGYYKGDKIRIPDWVKGRTYKVLQVSGEYVLLADIMSWFYGKDLEKV